MVFTSESPDKNVYAMERHILNLCVVEEIKNGSFLYFGWGRSFRLIKTVRWSGLETEYMVPIYINIC